MTSKQKRGCAVFIFYILVVTPISMYLQYRILNAINADSLMWFLFWVQVPIAFLVHFLINFTTE